MNVSESLIYEIVRKVLEESAKKAAPSFEKHIDPSGIIRIKTSTVACKPFAQEGVKVIDLLTLEEAPRMGVGIMELDRTSFAWTLTYDEYDMVIEGELHIVIDGRVMTAGPGDIIYIPKGSQIHFETPSFARYAYFVYPANWQEL